MNPFPQMFLKWEGIFVPSIKGVNLQPFVGENLLFCVELENPW